MNLEHLPSLVGIAAALGVSAFAVWKLVGVAMRVLFFLAAFAVGFGAIYGFTQLSGHPQALWVSGAEGLGFAWALSIIRARIARAITALAVLGLGQVTGWFGLGKKAPAPEKPPVKAAVKKHHSAATKHP